MKETITEIRLPQKMSQDISPRKISNQYVPIYKIIIVKLFYV